MRIFSALLIPLFVLCCFSINSQAEDKVTEAGLQKVFGPAAGKVVIVDEAPIIDGRLNDEVWQKAEERYLYYADQRVEGTPINLATVRFMQHGDHFYAGVHARGKINFAKAKGTDAGNIFRDSHIAMSWKTDERAYVLVINAANAKYHGSKTEKDTEWQRQWNPEDIVMKAARVDFGWQAEFQIPLKWMKNKDGTLPRLRRVDFFRRFWIYRVPTGTGVKMLRSFHAWKKRSKEDNLRLINYLNVFQEDDFGVVYFPNGDPKADNGMIPKIIEASKQTTQAAAQESKSKSEIKPGFEFSQDDLEKAFPGCPIMFVPITKSAPTIDGDASDESWKTAPKIRLNFLQSDIKGVPQRNITWIKALCDKTNLYFLYECGEEHLDAIKAQGGLVDKGALWTQDVCSAIFDPGRTQDEGSNSYVDISFNAAGSIKHSRRRSDMTWDPASLKFVVKQSKELKKWVIEFKIAVADLGIDLNNYPKVWGASFLRSRTPDRGVWIDRLQTKDPAYLNFDFAWRGNPSGRSHRPDYYGVLYIQAGNALPKDLHAKLVAQNDGKAPKEVKEWVLPRDAKINVKAAKKVDPKFKEAPKVLVQNGKAEIRFALEEASDIEVSILDDKGKIVRRLAAGVLGKNAPTPFKPDSLQQTIPWDMKDDLGKKVPPGNYVVRVAAGIVPEFERHLMWNPNGLREIKAISVDKDGNVYVVQTDHKVWYTAPLMTVYTREGKYLRQLLPYPGNLKDEDVKSAKQIELADGRKIPANFHGIYQSLSPAIAAFSKQRFAVASDGTVIICNGLSRTETRFTKRLLRIGSNGELRDNYLGPALAKSAGIGGPSAIALSPNDKYAYLVGLRGGGLGLHVVHRIDLENAPTTVPNEIPPVPAYLGEDDVPGSDEKHFKNPKGIAVDKDHNLYVADTGNDRVLIFDKDKKVIGKLTVVLPYQVEVHPKTGEIFVLSISSDKTVLSKYKDYKSKAASKSLDLPTYRWGGMALDSSQEIPRLWIMAIQSKDKKTQGSIIAVDDEKKGFKNLETVIADRNYEILNRRYGLPSMVDGRISADGDKAIVWGISVDTKTGAYAGGGAPIHRRGLDGLLYEKIKGKNQVVRRFDAEGKPFPFPASKSGDIKGPGGTIEFDVGPDGKVYILHQRGVDQYDKNGKLIKKNFIKVPSLPGTSGGANGTIRLDRENNVYLTTHLD